MSCVELSRARDLLVVCGGLKLIRAVGDEIVVRRLVKSETDLRGRAGEALTGVVELPTSSLISTRTARRSAGVAVASPPALLAP